MRMMKENPKRRKVFNSKKLGNRKRTTSVRTLRSKDLGDPPRNLEKEFVLKGHFFPQDDIFPAEQNLAYNCKQGKNKKKGKIFPFFLFFPCLQLYAKFYSAGKMSSCGKKCPFSTNSFSRLRGGSPKSFDLRVLTDVVLFLLPNFFELNTFRLFGFSFIILILSID